MGNYRRNKKEFNRAKNHGHTCSGVIYGKFARNRKRVNIIAEGDSWFAFPNTDIFAVGAPNIIQQMVIRHGKSQAINLLSLAANGDLAAHMLEDDSIKDFKSVLETWGGHTDFIMFSGGGNDLMVKSVMEAIIRKSATADSAQGWIDGEALKSAIVPIANAYRQLIQMRNEHAPQATIVLHTYCYATPRNRAAINILFGAIKIGPWIYPTLDGHEVPEKHWDNIVKVILSTLFTTLTATIDELYPDSSIDRKILHVDLLEALLPRHGSEWHDEIHPSIKGFKKLTRIISNEMHNIDPRIPLWA